MSDHCLFEAHRVDVGAPGTARRVAAGLAWDGLVTFECGPARAGVLALARREFDVPLAAYQVSGEFSLIEAAARAGWVDRDRMILESLTCIRRAGADFILTYFAKDVARLLGE